MSQMVILTRKPLLQVSEHLCLALKHTKRTKVFT